jgi:hypothetical protein
MMIGGFGVVLALAAIVAGFRVPTARAADDCGITAADIAQITAIQNNPSLTASEELSQELALRRQLVGGTITCAQQEVQGLNAELQSASTTDATGASIQSQLTGSLGGATDFYNIELQKLNGAGIAGTEAVAQEVLAWRSGTYVPLSENVDNFILWSQNQNLFDTASVRMDETQRAVSFLESATPDADLQSAFDAAQSSFNDAQSENIAARTAVAEQLSPDQSLALIKQSLNSLSNTYQDFFTISTLIKGILPQ